MDGSPPVSSVHGILQARILEWVAVPFSRESSWLRDRTWVSPIAGRFCTFWATREAKAQWLTVTKIVCYCSQFLWVRDSRVPHLHGFWLKISHEIALMCQLGMWPSNTAGVPNLWDLMPNDLKWSWFYNDRNKLHNKYNALGSSQNHAPIPWPMENLSSTKPVPGVKNVGDHCNTAHSHGWEVGAVEMLEYWNSSHCGSLHRAAWVSSRCGGWLSQSTGSNRPR